MERKEDMTETLKGLRVGTVTTLQCRKPTHCESVRSLCYRIPQVYEDYRGRKYTCKINYIKSQITISVTSIK